MVMQVQPFMTAGRLSATRRVSGYTQFICRLRESFYPGEAVRLKRDYERLIIVCGHYEGVDERFIELCVDEEISVVTLW